MDKAPIIDSLGPKRDRGGINIPGPVRSLLVVTVIHLDADFAADTVPVDVEHVAVGLADGLLHQVAVAHVDLLLQSLGLPDILCSQTSISTNRKKQD